MNMRHASLKNRGILVAAMVLMGASAAQAAPITWDAVQNISGNTDVSTNGALVGAFNLGGSTTTVNGVTFSEFAIPAAQTAPFVPVTSVTVGLYTLELVSFEHDPQTLASFDTSSGSAPFSGISAGYQSLLGTAAGQVWGERENILTMAGLTVGQHYEFQAWVNDSASSGKYMFDVGLSDQAGGGGLSLRPNTAFDALIGTDGEFVAGGLGQYVIGTFTAEANSQEVYFGRTEIGGGLNGFQLRALSTQAVPEPASLALLGLGLAGLGFSRRIRRHPR